MLANTTTCPALPGRGGFGALGMRFWQPDAFGNALGESIKDQMAYGGSSDGGTAYNDGDIGRSELRMSSAPPPSFPDLTAVGSADGFEGYLPPNLDRSQDVLLAAGDGFTMGRGPVSVGQSGRTVYLSDQGSQPSIDSMLAEAQAQLEALKASGQGVVELPQVVITGHRMTDAEKAAYDAEQAQGLLQGQNDEQVIAGSYNKFGAALDSAMGGNWSRAWAHLNYEPSDAARAAVYARVFPLPNPVLARIDAAAGGPIGAAAVLMTRNSSARDQYYAAQAGMHADAVVGSLTGAYPQTLTAKPPTLNLLASRTRALGGQIDIGNVDSFGRLQRVVGDGSVHRDHIPSKAALLERATQLKGDTLSPTERRRIVNEATAVTVPADIHRLGPSYGQTASQARSDALDLASARSRDADAMVLNARNRVSQEQLEALMSARERLLGKDNAAYDAWLRSRLDPR